MPSKTFPSAESSLESAAGDEPDCLLVDIRMPGMSGLDLVEELGWWWSTLDRGAPPWPA